MDQALLQVPSPELLVNLVSRRVRQFAQGHRPLTQTDPKMDFATIALKEISEGKLRYEIEELPDIMVEETNLTL